MDLHPPSETQLPNLSGLTFRLASSNEELEPILHCRWRGYKKYGFAQPSDCRDAFDERATQYICLDSESQEVLGCLRLLACSARPFEVETFLDVSQWLPSGTTVAELTRFSVPICKRISAIKFGLWKLAWLDAIAKGHTHFLIWTTEHKKRMYEYLGFVPYPNDSTAFNHPILGNHSHIVMTVDLTTVAELFQRTRPELHRFFFETAISIFIQPQNAHEDN
jgi:hypothetical protein